MEKCFQEAVRYLGYGKNPVDEATSRLVEKGFLELEKVSALRSVFRIFQVPRRFQIVSHHKILPALPLHMPEAQQRLPYLSEMFLLSDDPLLSLMSHRTKQPFHSDLSFLQGFCC